MKIVLLSTFLVFANPSFAACGTLGCDFYAYGDSTSSPDYNYDVKVTYVDSNGVFIESEDVRDNARPSPQPLDLRPAYARDYKATVYFTDKNWNKLGEMSHFYFSPNITEITGLSTYIDRLAISYQRNATQDASGRVIFLRLLGVYKKDNDQGNIQYLPIPNSPNSWLQYDAKLFNVHF